MPHSIKGCALIAIFILLTIDFPGDDRNMVEGGVVEVVKVKQVEIKKDEDTEDQEADDGPEEAYKRREASLGTKVPSQPLDESGKYIGQYDPECNEAIILTPTKKEVELEMDTKLLKHGGTTCHWTVIGTDDCIPSVTCKKFHLDDPTDDKDDPCQEEYFEITDGSFGYQKYCGKNGPESVTSGRKFRDFYITLKLAAKKQSRGLKCTVTCNEGKVHGNPLDENSEPEVNEDCNCGRKPNADRIVGGEDSKKGEFPWMSAMVAAGTRKPFCGSSIINNRFILTAAHCFKGPYMKAKNINILINAHKMDYTDSKVASGQGGSKSSLTPEQLEEKDRKDGSHRFTVESYFIHPLYVRQTNDFDVALIKLEKPIDFGKIKQVMPACLPPANRYMESKEGAPAVITGWGLNSSDATVTQSTLQKLDLPVFTDEECTGFYGARYTRRFLCAGFKEGGKDSCKGDSGGPLVSEKTKQVWEQIGIVSFGEGCAVKNQPGVYINTRQVSQWIRYISNMEEAVWCHGSST